MAHVHDRADELNKNGRYCAFRKPEDSVGNQFRKTVYPESEDTQPISVWQGNKHRRCAD